MTEEFKIYWDDELDKINIEKAEEKINFDDESWELLKEEINEKTPYTRENWSCDIFLMGQIVIEMRKLNYNLSQIDYDLREMTND